MLGLLSASLITVLISAGVGEVVHLGKDAGDIEAGISLIVGMLVFAVIGGVFGDDRQFDEPIGSPSKTGSRAPKHTGVDWDTLQQQLAEEDRQFEENIRAIEERYARKLERIEHRATLNKLERWLSQQAGSGQHPQSGFESLRRSPLPTQTRAQPSESPPAQASSTRAGHRGTEPVFTREEHDASAASSTGSAKHEGYPSGPMRSHSLTPATN